MGGLGVFVGSGGFGVWLGGGPWGVLVAAGGAGVFVDGGGGGVLLAGGGGVLLAGAGMVEVGAWLGDGAGVVGAPGVSDIGDPVVPALVATGVSEAAGVLPASVAEEASVTAGVRVAVGATDGSAGSSPPEVPASVEVGAAVGKTSPRANGVGVPWVAMASAIASTAGSSGAPVAASVCTTAR